MLSKRRTINLIRAVTHVGFRFPWNHFGREGLSASHLQRGCGAFVATGVLEWHVTHSLEPLYCTVAAISFASGSAPVSKVQASWVATGYARIQSGTLQEECRSEEQLPAPSGAGDGDSVAESGSADRELEICL